MEYERLTAEKVKGTTERYIRVDKDYILSAYDIIDEEKQDFVEMIIDRLAELEDKIEQGKMIELPCKVGDTVYYVIKHGEHYAIEIGFVKGITIQNDGIWLACHYNSGLSYWHKHKDEELFFDIAKAEAKIKELKEV